MVLEQYLNFSLLSRREMSFCSAKPMEVEIGLGIHHRNNQTLFAASRKTKHMHASSVLTSNTFSGVYVKKKGQFL